MWGFLVLSWMGFRFGSFWGACFCVVELGLVSFIGSLVSPLICTGGWSGGVQQVALVHVFLVESLGAGGMGVGQ